MNLKGLDRDKLIDFIDWHCKHEYVQPICIELEIKSYALYRKFAYLFSCKGSYFTTLMFPNHETFLLSDEQWHQVYEARRNALALFLVLIDFKEDFTEVEE